MPSLGDPCGPPAVSWPPRFPSPKPLSPRFMVEELLPYSQPEQTAANLPLPLDDARGRLVGGLRE